MANRSLLVLALIACGCQSSTTSKVSSGADAAVPSGGAGGQAMGGSSRAGGTTGLGGTRSSAGGAGNGGVAGNGGITGSGGANANGGTGMGGTTGGIQADASPDTSSDASSDARPGTRPDGPGSGGAAGAGGTAMGSGGIGGAGGSLPEAGLEVGGDAKPDLPSDTAKDGGPDTGAYSKPVPVPDGGTCPSTGHVTYTLSKSANPTADEQNAYAKITAAMDQAVAYYNCYTNITKAEVVEYDGSVKTADGNSNGTIRFGSDTSYMVLPTAMHEISHTVGVGTASKWRSFVAIPDGGTSGPWTGANAIAQRTALLPDGNQTYLVPNADTQHFWPYGLNYASEYKTEADLLGHCVMVMALRKDMGLQ